MNIIFVTTQSPLQSTLIGRVFPLAQEFKKMGHQVTVLVHQENTPIGKTLRVNEKTLRVEEIGPNPFQRILNGKQRYSGLQLVATMLMNALRAAWQLIKEKPEIVIMVKPLPENTLAVLLAKLFLKQVNSILDVDDFELEANHLTSLLQRAALHWSERASSRMASHIVVATPFLQDHMQLLSGHKKPVTLIPTGLPASSTLGVFPLTPSVFPAGSSRHTLLFAGSLSIASGHRVDMLPEILSIVRNTIPDARLIIAGSGDDENILKEQFEKLGLGNSADWRGRFSLATISDVIKESSILIDPIDASIANRAKSSFRAALALSYGVPIVTSSIGIRTDMIPSVLHEKFFAKPGDAASYAEKITALLQQGISHEEQSLLRAASEPYQYDHLARIYYNCLV